MLSYGWRVVGSVEGFERWEINRPDMGSKWLERDTPAKLLEMIRREKQLVRMVKSEKLWILERDSGSATWF